MSALKYQLLETGEEWSEAWEYILDYHPNYLAAYIRLRKVPLDRQALDRKTQELILLAMDASCTHLFTPGISAHINGALQCGARVSEIMETLELVSVLGVHAMTVGVPLLLEVMNEGMEMGDFPRELDGPRQAMKEDFINRRGYWNTYWEPVLRLSPRFFEAYLMYSSLPFEESGNALPPKIKELIYCAIDCSTTHLYGPGLKIHIRNAIEAGAQPDEVLEVFQLATLMGAQTVLIGAQTLKEELDRMRTKAMLYRRASQESQRSVHSNIDM
ncbi:gamma-carboxymuconolactone decarboxylase like protein [Zymoseptoria brevis]|uniref:Gamma-carboxymuconolactone decarboxylase like protein n=1 Tax=Zymoseptoria brevis TaxID=1047168 RepID=A0A0F4GX92_9PEZI|nr:gamma-carboxymuconolactone decarboxylase like protein [Zymoseptoria brevis]